MVNSLNNSVPFIYNKDLKSTVFDLLKIDFETMFPRLFTVPAQPTLERWVEKVILFAEAYACSDKDEALERLTHVDKATLGFRNTMILLLAAIVLRISLF